MRLVQLEGPSGGAPLSFHPQVTVVGGLDDALRARLLDALRALPAGADPGWAGLVEAHGVVLDLHRESLRLLGMQHEVDVVVGAGDLPVDGEPRADAIAAPAQADQLESLRLSHDILEHGVTALKRSRIEYEEARLQAVEAIEEARAELDPFATTAFEQAAAAFRRAEEAGEQPAPEPVVTESLEDLEAERDRLQAALADLDEVDTAPVAEALHLAERTPELAADTLLDVDAVQALIDELRAAEAAVEQLDAARREAGRDPSELVRRIEAARIQLERLETSSAPPTLTPEDRDELEAAHDAVIEADAKVNTTKLGGKAARQALDAALAAEQEILQRVGFPTYSAFALAQSAPGPDPETRVELEATRKELAELEAAYHDALALDTSDPERAELEAHRDQLRRDAGHLVDAEGPDVLAALAGLLGAPAGGTEETSGAAQLRDRLAEHGVDFGDLGLSDDEVVDVARVWLADMQAMEERRVELERELDTVQARLLVVAPAMGQGEGAPDKLTRAQQEVEAAESRLASHRQASDRVAELCGLLEEIEARLADLGEHISAQEALVAAAAEGLAAAEGRLASIDDDVDELAGFEGLADLPPPEDLLLGVPEDHDDIEWYLLTRLAGLRALSFAGSVPLVLDGALAALDREDAHRVLDKIEAMTDVVQVVYLGDDDAVVEWAALHGPGAAVITVGENVTEDADEDIADDLVPEAVG